MWNNGDKRLLLIFSKFWGGVTKVSENYLHFMRKMEIRAARVSMLESEAGSQLNEGRSKQPWVSAPPSALYPFLSMTQFFTVLLKMLNAYFKKNKKESFLLCSSKACQHNLVSTHDHLQAILGKELKCKNHIWSCKCALRVCEEGEEWLKRRVMNKQVLTQ